MTIHTVNRGLANVFAGPFDLTKINQPELANQVALNEQVIILGEQDDYFHVRTSDTCEGWMKIRHLTTIDSALIEHLECRVVTALSTAVRESADPGAKIIMVVTLGTTLLMHPDFSAESRPIDSALPIVLPDGSSGFVCASDIGFDTSTDDVTQGSTLAASALLAALRLTGIPYHWGGTTPLGIDCSGLVLLAYRMAGLSVKRNACMQFNDERFDLLHPGSFERADFRAGDLLFFRGLQTAKVTHVGLATGGDSFIHASPYSGESSVVVEPRVANRYAARFAGVGRLRDLVPTRIQS